MKIGDREVTKKEFVLVAILLLVAGAGVWAMLGIQSKPSGGTLPDRMAYPRGVALDPEAGTAYVADSRNHRVVKLGLADLKISGSFGSYADVSAVEYKKKLKEGEGRLNEPNAVAVGPDGLVYVMDTWNGRVQVFDAKGRHKRTFSAEDGFFAPRGIVVDAEKYVYVADTGKHRIVKFDPEGRKIRAWGTKGDKTGEFNEPIGLALDKSGSLYVADRLNFRIQVFDGEGRFLREWPVEGWSKEQVDMEPHLAIDQAREILCASDGRGKKVLCYRLNGKKLSSLDKDASGAAFTVPLGLSFDGQGNLLVVDAGAARVLKLAVPAP